MKINTQDITKASYDASFLRLHSMFYTIQGEGPYTGRPALFVRLAGCNIQCYWCDTQYTEIKYCYTEELANQIMNQLKGRPSNTIVVLTGGEPMAQPISPLIKRLSTSQITVQIESNGTACPPDFPWNDRYVQLVLSPKTSKVHRDIKQSEVLAWKYVISASQKAGNKDGLPYESTQKQDYQMMIARPPKGTANHKIYISPMDEQSETINRSNRRWVVTVAKLYGYTVSLQTHKILEVE